MMEDKFEELFELEENNKLMKQVNKSLYKKVFKMFVLPIICICLIITCIFSFYQSVVRNSYYDPLNESGIAELYDAKKSGVSYEELSKQEKERLKLEYYDYLMATYYSVFVPGTYYNGSSSIEYMGKGEYEIYGSMDDGFRNANSSYMKYILSQNTNLSDVFASNFVFDCDEEDTEGCYTALADNWEDKQKLEMQNEVELMPDSSIYMVYVNYKDEIALSNWDETNIPAYDYKYVLTDFTSDSRYVGFTLDDFSGANTFGMAAEQINKGYFMQFPSTTAEEFYNHFKIRLKILAEHEEFVSTFGSEDTMEFINKALEKVENKEVEVKGYMAHVSKSELEEILVDKNTSYVVIEDVKYSKYEK